MPRGWCTGDDAPGMMHRGWCPGDDAQGVMHRGWCTRGDAPGLMHRGWCSGGDAPGVMHLGWCTGGDALGMMLIPKCIYPKCIIAKCTRLAYLLSLGVYSSYRTIQLICGKLIEHFCVSQISSSVGFNSNLGYVCRKKDYGMIWEFFPTWGGGLPNSKNFCCTKNSPKISLKHCQK